MIGNRIDGATRIEVLFRLWNLRINIGMDEGSETTKKENLETGGDAIEENGIRPDADSCENRFRYDLSVQARHTSLLSASIGPKSNTKGDDSAIGLLR